MTVGRNDGMAAALADVLLEAGQDPLPADALKAAQLLILHSLGVSLAGAHLPQCQIAYRSITDARGSSTVFGREHRLPVADAAFVNGVSGHASYHEDAGGGGLNDGSHPGTYVIPAALAAAEERHATGMQLLRAVVVGYEAASRIGTACPRGAVRRGFRIVPLLGPFGAAAAVAVIDGLDAIGLAHALGLAAQCSGGFNEGFLAGSMEQYFHAGWAARAGLHAARLAGAGAVASPQSLEGPRGFFQTLGGDAGDLEALTAPRSFRMVCRVHPKRFPACLQNQSTMSLLSRAPIRVPVADIESVQLARPASGQHGLDAPSVTARPPFQTMGQLQMSARFTTAASLLGRPVETIKYFEGALADSDAIAVAERVDITESRGDDIVVRVRLRDGRTVLRRGSATKMGSMTTAETHSAFLRRVQPHLPHAGKDIADAVNRTHDMRDVRELTHLLGIDTTTAVRDTGDGATEGMY